MARTTTFIVETTGGSPVFHIPFPISSLGALAGIQGDGQENENVKFVFRNRGGTPTFHVGGAEVGVSPADAWDYATVVKAVMRERRLKVEGQSERAAEGVGMPQVRVKVEEDTPRMPAKTKRKGQEREVERGNELGGSRLGECYP
jgi:hypothetical protein